MSWQLPQKTDWMKEQMAHEPTREYAEEIHKIIKEHKPDYKNALEIGCAWGVSTLSIMLAGDGYLTSVDMNQTRADREVEENDLRTRWTFEHQNSHDFWKSNDQAFDLIYIDGSHLYKDVVNDLFRAWEWLTPDGILLIDDFVHEKNIELDIKAKEPIYGVSYAICQLIQQKSIRKIGTTKKIFYTWRTQ